MRRPARLLLMLMCLPLTLAACDKREGVRVYETTPVAAYAWPETEAGEDAAEGMVWTVPAGFVKQADVPDSLFGDYRAAGPSPQLPLRLTVSMLPGDGGGLEANVARWQGQFLAVPPRDLRGVVTVSPPFMHTRGTVRIVQINGQYAGPTIPSAMLAAVVTLQDREGRPYATWFLKLTGDRASVEGAAEALTQVVFSLRPEGTPLPDVPSAPGGGATPGGTPAPPPILRRPEEPTE